MRMIYRDISCNKQTLLLKHKFVLNQLKLPCVVVIIIIIFPLQRELCLIRTSCCHIVKLFLLKYTHVNVKI